MKIIYSAIIILSMFHISMQSVVFKHNQEVVEVRHRPTCCDMLHECGAWVVVLCACYELYTWNDQGGCNCLPIDPPSSMVMQDYNVVRDRYDKNK